MLVAWLAAMPEYRHARVIGLCYIQTDFELVISPAETNLDIPTKALIAVKLGFSGVPPELSHYRNSAWRPYVGSECAHHSRWAASRLTNPSDQWHLASSAHLACFVHK